jgi:hypothetical protein
MSPPRLPPWLDRHALFACSASAALLLACCSPARREVSLVVEHGGEPMAGAHVRATPLETGPVPLPVSLEMLERYIGATDQTVATDARGRAVLSLFARTPHLIEVVPPPLGPLAEHGPWAWVLPIGASTLTPLAHDRAAGEPHAPRVMISR